MKEMHPSLVRISQNLGDELAVRVILSVYDKWFRVRLTHQSSRKPVHCLWWDVMDVSGIR